MAPTAISDVYTTILKTLYSTDRIENLVYPHSPFLGLVKKWEDFAGYDFKELVLYGDIKGAGNIFSTALANVATSNETAFSVTRVKGYAIAQLYGEVIEASRSGDKAAFIAVLKRQMDSALNVISMNLSHQIYRNQYGARGQVGASSATTTVYLTNIDDVVNFEVGMKLVASGTDGGALRSNTTTTITAIDRDLGKLTVGTSIAGLSWATNDYIYRDADTDAVVGTPATGLSLSGLDAWLPSSTTGLGTAFFGVTRSADATRLAGIRYDGTSKNIAEALIGGAYRAGREGAKIDHYFMNFAAFEALVDLLGSKVQYVTESAYKNPNIGFEGVKVIGPQGPINCYADQFCPSNVAYGLQLNTWTLRSLNKAPHILDLDSLQLLRASSTDSYELRWGYYGNLTCNAPGFNVRVGLSI